MLKKIVAYQIPPDIPMNFVQFSYACVDVLLLILLQLPPESIHALFLTCTDLHRFSDMYPEEARRFAIQYYVYQENPVAASKFQDASEYDYNLLTTLKIMQLMEDYSKTTPPRQFSAVRLEAFSSIIKQNSTLTFSQLQFKLWLEKTYEGTPELQSFRNIFSKSPSSTLQKLKSKLWLKTAFKETPELQRFRDIMMTSPKLTLPQLLLRFWVEVTCKRRPNFEECQFLYCNPKRPFKSLQEDMEYLLTLPHVCDSIVFSIVEKQLQMIQGWDDTIENRSAFFETARVASSETAKVAYSETTGMERFLILEKQFAFLNQVLKACGEIEINSQSFGEILARFTIFFIHDRMHPSITHSFYSHQLEMLKDPNLTPEDRCKTFFSNTSIEIRTFVDQLKLLRLKEIDWARFIPKSSDNDAEDTCKTLFSTIPPKIRTFVDQLMFLRLDWSMATETLSKVAGEEPWWLLWTFMHETKTENFKPQEIQDILKTLIKWPFNTQQILFTKFVELFQHQINSEVLIDLLHSIFALTHEYTDKRQLLHILMNLWEISFRRLDWKNIAWMRERLFELDDKNTFYKLYDWILINNRTNFSLLEKQKIIQSEIHAIIDWSLNNPTLLEKLKNEALKKLYFFRLCETIEIQPALKKLIHNDPLDKQRCSFFKQFITTFEDLITPNELRAIILLVHHTRYTQKYKCQVLKVFRDACTPNWLLLRKKSPEVVAIFEQLLVSTNSKDLI